jgi:hypothetical protein
MSIKDQVLQMISETNDEHLLELIKADIEYFSNKGTDILDELNAVHRNELLKLIDEPDEKDTLTEDEYKAATAKWRNR